MEKRKETLQHHNNTKAEKRRAKYTPVVLT
jgi:hypothetical protein